MYVSPTRRRIRYFADLNGVARHGETWAHSFAEVQSQLDEIFINARLINIQFMED